MNGLTGFVVGAVTAVGLELLIGRWLKGSGKRLGQQLQHFFGKDPRQLPIISRTFATLDLPICSSLSSAIWKVRERQAA